MREKRHTNEEKTLKTLEKHLGKRCGVKDSDLGGEQVLTDRRNESQIATNQYIEFQ